MDKLRKRLHDAAALVVVLGAIAAFAGTPLEWARAALVDTLKEDLLQSTEFEAAITNTVTPLLKEQLASDEFNEAVVAAVTPLLEEQLASDEFNAAVIAAVTPLLAQQLAPLTTRLDGLEATTETNKAGILALGYILRTSPSSDQGLLEDFIQTPSRNTPELPFVLQGPEPVNDFETPAIAIY